MMPSTKCIYNKELFVLNLLTKKCSCLYLLRQGPYITVYIYTEHCNNAGLSWSYSKVLQRQLEL